MPIIEYPSKHPHINWVISNLLSESRYIEISNTPFSGGPYYYRENDRTIWKFRERRIIPICEDTNESQSVDNTCGHKEMIVLCFDKVVDIWMCELIQESYNISLGSFTEPQQDKHGYKTGVYISDIEGANKWYAASSNDPRRIKYNNIDQCKHPYTLSIVLKPNILQKCLNNHQKLNKMVKKHIKQERIDNIAILAGKLNLQELENVPIELSRYSRKRKRRYYIEKSSMNTTPVIWFVNHLDPRYRDPVTFWKPESFDELRDVCLVNNLEVPPRRYLTMQRSILYCDT